MVVVVHGGGREEGHEFQRRQVGAHDAVRVLIVERRPLRQRRTGRRSYRPHTHTHTHTQSQSPDSRPGAIIATLIDRPGGPPFDRSASFPSPVTHTDTHTHTHTPTHPDTRAHLVCWTASSPCRRAGRRNRESAATSNRRRREGRRWRASGCDLCVHRRHTHTHTHTHTERERENQSSGWLFYCVRA